MSDQKGKSSKRYRPTYFYTTLSISLVLYLLGLLSLIVAYYDNLVANYKENLKIEVELHSEYKEADKNKLQKELEAQAYVKSAEYISKEMALERIKRDSMGFYLFLVDNIPVYASIDLYLYKDYTNLDSLDFIEAEIKKFPIVKNLNYPRDLVENIQYWAKYISIIILAVLTITFIVTLTLVNSTIRLSMYSNRFLIKSMQLVGATSGFIVRPFIIRGVTSGLISGIIASLLLVGTIVYLHQTFPELNIVADYKVHIALIVLILILGIFVSWISTAFAVRKYLRMKLDDLY